MNNLLTNSNSKKIISIALFYVIAISLRYYIAEFKPEFWQNANLYIKVLLLAVGPFIGGLVVIKFLKRPFKLTLSSIGFLKSFIIVLIPIILFSLVGILENGTPYLTAPKYIGILLFYALFEEFGWRGYLQAELNGIKKFYKYLIITVLWFVWHLNFELSINNLIFFMLLFAGSYGIGYLADKYKSLIICALFHSFSNIFHSELLSEIQLNHKLIIIAISAVSAIIIMNYRYEKPTITNLSSI